MKVTAHVLITLTSLPKATAWRSVLMLGQDSSPEIVG